MKRFWNNLQQVLSKSKVWKVVHMTRFWNNLQQVIAAYSRNVSCSLLSKPLILSVPAAGYSRHALCSLLSKPK
jgi:hypothetical protein